MKFKKFNPNDYVMVIKKGEIVKEGLGLSVFFNELNTSITVVPTTAFDDSFNFDELVTSDYQSVYVQGVITYMITNYREAVKMFDFSYKPNSKVGNRIDNTMATLEKRINNIIKSIVIREVSKKDVRTIIRQVDEMAGTIQSALVQDEAIEKLGISVISVNVLGISPKPETRKALEAAAREEILKEQDDAIYKRRNAAIEQERIIKENEINTEIKVSEKEKEKEEKEQELKQYLQKCELDMNMKEMRANLEMEKERQEKQFALKEMAAAKKAQIDNQEMLGRIELEKKNKEFTALEVENERIKANQKAEAVAALVKAYNGLNVGLVEACAMAGMDPSTLMAKAFMNIGQNADKIGTLNFTPDLLQTIAAGITPKEKD